MTRNGLIDMDPHTCSLLFTLVGRELLQIVSSLFRLILLFNTITIDNSQK